MSASLEKTIQQLETQSAQMAESYLKKIDDASRLREEAERELSVLTTRLEEEQQSVRSLAELDVYSDRRGIAVCVVKADPSGTCEKERVHCRQGQSHFSVREGTGSCHRGSAPLAFPGLVVSDLDADTDRGIRRWHW